MGDIATIWNAAAGTADWAATAPVSSIWTDERGNAIVDQIGSPVSASFTAGSGLSGGSDLVTAVLISLFTDAEAGPDDVIPDASQDPRGWWAGPIGSKLWLRYRMKATPSVLAFVKSDIQDALAWLIADGVVAAIDVVTEFTRPRMLGASVVLRRADGARMALNFARLWETT